MNSLVRDIQTRNVGPVPSADSFRNAMRSLAGGVSVVTVGQGRDVSGMTVTSVSSLSIEPATLIVSINRGTSSWPLLQKYGVFGVNILSAKDAGVAACCSGIGGLKGADRFTSAEWTRLVTGVPLLTGALSAFDCEVEHVVERHSHAIVIGRVLDLRILDNSDGGLVYWNGKYASVRPEQEKRDQATDTSLTSRALWEV